ncbi:MAG: outer membrane beta-barrel protein [Cyclobacteriaceae bacterium]|nr:outer membrane beta-barrel protein [Cyclobacteriaceae bacterium]
MRIVFGFLLIFLVNLLHGQDLVERISLTTLAGINESILYGSKSPFSDLNYRMRRVYGEFYGVSAGVRLKRNALFSIGLMQESKGGEGIYNSLVQQDNSIYSQYRKVTVQNNYVTVPISLQIFTVEDKYRFFGEVGSYISFLTRTQIRSYLREIHTIDDVVFSERIEHVFVRERQLTNSFDLGFLAGCGFEYKIAERIYLQAKLFGLLGLLKVDGKYSNDTRIIVDTSNTLVLELDYFGLNSYSRNFSYGIGLGFRYNFLTIENQ